MSRVQSLLRNEWVLLGLVIAISIFFRFYRLDTIPLGLHSDEAVMGYHARHVLQAKQFPIFFEENRGQEPMKMYLTALLLPLLGETAIAIRTVSALAGVMTVALLYLLVKELFPEEDGQGMPSSIGLMAALWLALSYWHVSYSRLGMEPILLPLFVTITIYFTWRGIRSGRNLDYALSGLFLGLSLYTYRAARLFPLVFLVYAAACFLLSRRLPRRQFANWVILFAVAALVFAPLGYFALTNWDVYFTRAGDVTVFNPELNQGSPVRALLKSTVQTMASFLVLPDPNWRQNPAARPLLDPVTGVLFLVGLGITLFRWRRPNYLFILVWLFVMALPATLTASGMPHSSRSIGLVPVACILPAIGLHELCQLLKRRSPSRVMLQLSRLAVVMVFLLVGAFTYWDYFTAWSRDELPPAFDMAFVEAAEVMNVVSQPDGVWILPLTPLADPGSVHYTVEFLYQGDAPHHFLRVDEDTVAEELTAIAKGRDKVSVVEWDPAVLGGAYLYHADPKGVLSYLLSKHGAARDEGGFHAFDVLSYGLPAGVHFAIADSFEPVNAAFGDQIALTGVAHGGSAVDETGETADLGPPAVRSGEQAWVALRWEAVTTPSADYKAAAYLVDSRDRVLAQMDKVLLSSQMETTTQWVSGQEEMDYYTLSIPPATPPGEYQIEVAVYEAETSARLPVLDAEGRMTGQSKRVGSIQIVKPLVPPQVKPQTEIADGELAPGIRLLGYDLPLREVEPGGVLRLALYWNALHDVEEDYVLSLELRDQAGQVQMHYEERPVDDSYPTTQWEEGEILRDWHDVPVPPDTPQEEYELVVIVLEGDGVQGQASLGSVAVKGRPHYYTVPDIQHPSEVTVGENIRLLGYALEREQVKPGDTIRLTLYWQALARMETSYTVFTHLLDAEHGIRGQKDSIPGNGALPTTSWVEGEVITDLYELVVDADAPSGSYVLEIGAYDAATGLRLSLHDASGEPLGDRLLLESTVDVQ